MDQALLRLNKLCSKFYQRNVLCKDMVSEQQHSCTWNTRKDMAISKGCTTFP